MKFILDAHIPKKLSLFLTWKGFDSIHTLDLPNKNRTKDSQIRWIRLIKESPLLEDELANKLKLFEIVGIWKDRDITQELIREQAWK